MGGLSAQLTKLEIEILQLVSSGNSAKQIAHELGVSIYTVDEHCENARRKLGCTTTAEACCAAIRKRVMLSRAP